MKEDDIKKLADDLLGTCNKIPDDLNLETKDLEVLDSLVDQCCECGYWFESEYIQYTEDGPTCSECLEIE